MSLTSPPHGTVPAADILVIGAGLAGAATASALAEQGCRVTVIAAPAAPAASSVPLALMAPHAPTSARDPLTVLRYQGARITPAWLARLEQNGLDSGRRTDGVLLVPARPRERQRRDRLVASERVRRLTPAEARTLTGITPPESAVLHAGGGCVDPGVFTGTLLRLAAARIRQIQAHVLSLERHRGHWHALTPHGESVAAAATVVVAAGIESIRFSALAAERLSPVRGQATAFAATALTRTLRYAISHGGYVLPEYGGVHWVGATATRDDMDLTPRAADDSQNATRLAALWPEIGKAAPVDRFVAIRATTDDRLPLVGAAGDGLWLNTGHGSHGLLTAPAAARTIARAIARGDALPLTRRTRHRRGHPIG